MIPADRTVPVGGGGAAEVRRITEHDWSDWRAIRLRALAEAPEAFGSRLDEVDDREPTWRARIEAAEACFLASAGDAVVGMVAADPVPDGIALQSMFVVDEARGRGVGSRLIDAVLTVAGQRPLVLGVMGANAPAIRAYERAGFVHDDHVSAVDCELTMRHDRSTEEKHHAR